MFKLNDITQIDHAALVEICHQYHIQKLALFGSVLHDNQRPNSDLDILVEFAEGKTPGFGFFRLQDELSLLFDCPVDLNTSRCLSRYFRDEVVAEAKVLYVA